MCNKIVVKIVCNGNCGREQQMGGTHFFFPAVLLLQTVDKCDSIARSRHTHTHMRKFNKKVGLDVSGFPL